MNDNELLLLQSKTKNLIDSYWPEMFDSQQGVSRLALQESIRASLNSTRTLTEMWNRVKELVSVLNVEAPTIAIAAVVEQVDTILILLGGVEEQLLELHRTFR